ncbi:DUF6011 domain-containing protein [Streptomyces chartreusis]|uniref:DUF6011 domain-containing protein n=1 Tax=Streptomyces chartreusis TaxID=1969 RepID=UPI00341DF60E
MTKWSQCRFCPRRLTDPESQRRGYGEKCGRDRGLIPPKRRRTRIRPTPRPKPATVPPAPDVIPGQTEIPLTYLQVTLESL